MKLHVVAFASAREALGTEELDLELDPGSDLEALRRNLIARAPALEELWSRLAIAVDGELVRANVELAEGQEIALLPPVSGGEPQRAALVDGLLEPRDLLASVAAPSRGAVVLFLGNVRDGHRGRPVEHLTYDAYRPMAQTALERIVDEESDSKADLVVAVHHRLGVVSVGGTSVVIAAASPHRGEAYAASRRVLERLKAEVPIWKREHYVDGEAVWREEEALGSRRPKSEVSTAG